jgi:Uma2 family endonuclease
MVTRRGKQATYDDLKNLPDNVVGEILGGELFVSPRPSSPHARAATGVGSDLFGAFDRPPGGAGPGGWWILVEPELHFHGGDVLVPDLAGWRRERMPRMPDVPAFELAPDWVCEIVSPATSRIDRNRKQPIYAREKVAWLWIVDPLAHTIEVYHLEPDGAWKLLGNHGEEERVRLPPFDAIELEPNRWWLPEES